VNVKIIEENKKDFLDLLLLADEEEDRIDLYLERGVLFALYDDDLKSVCVVTSEGEGSYEMQSLATYPQFQRRGYGRYLTKYVCEYYKKKGAMIVGTGDSLVPFYEKSGFAFSYRVKDYFLLHYKEPMYDAGVQLKDKVYLKRNL